MVDTVITAAGMVSEEGYGSPTLGRRSWSAPGEPPSFAWSVLFSSPCPRFGRMDGLSRLSLAAVELMGVDFEGMRPEEKADIGVCMGTPAGSAGVDVEFWLGREGAGGPSPALFTYTLPSTAMGEICIRHGLKGPDLCLMLGSPADGVILAEAQERLKRCEALACVCVLANAVDRAAAGVLGAAEGDPAAGSYAYALYLQNRAVARRRGEPVLSEAPPGGDSLRAVCEGLCGFAGRGPVSI